ncbi:hypothetical protein COEREDRAFT_81329 [Coemansia reversa NRRL 1564]|uniref:Uncharacterized protein n=1 Tax=Coemansia reversa (strain ATCC 12441 / NRRL 1564) TaxID=763665 RepID=A0A2G5BBI8_COERN|nr:hypothetical protein COEREDRAFT_81329 [Coemansia reversa NRRL 1564]|eukprot:PIA16371.1 hypothetical protein COEREDRAFT_81329 [Coemansia reversa NRRL 1564]
MSATETPHVAVSMPVPTEYAFAGDNHSYHPPSEQHQQNEAGKNPFETAENMQAHDNAMFPSDPSSQHHAQLVRHATMLRDRNLTFNAHRESMAHAEPSDVIVENCAPVFEVGYWMNFGNFSSVRQQHEAYKDHVRTLSVWNLPVESAYGADVAACLNLGWPNVTHVSLEYSTWEPEPNRYSISWHKILCESPAFPNLIDYRVWQMLPARLEVFSIHKFKTVQERNQATDIIAQVPDLLAPTPAVQQFYEHRCRYLEHVVMSMDSMNKAETYTKYKYLALVLATPVMAPRTLTIVNSRLKHIRAILNCIDRNALGLPTTQLQYQPGKLELGRGLQHLHLKMTSLYDELTGLPISAARFPDLTSLIIEHSPALDNSLPDGEKFGQLWDMRWASMKRLQLPFFSDQHAALLIKFMPNLEILSIMPTVGFESGDEYPDALSVSTLVKLTTQLQMLRHFEIRSMLRFKTKKPINLGDQIALALKKPPTSTRPDLKLLAMPCIHMDFVSVVKLLTHLPGVEQLEFQLPDQYAVAATPASKNTMPTSPVENRNGPAIAHNLEGRSWPEEKKKFAELYADKPHPLQSMIITGYHTDLHSTAVSEFLGLFPDLDSLAFTSINREDHDNIDQLAGVLTALNPDLEVAII